MDIKDEFNVTMDNRIFIEGKQLPPYAGILQSSIDLNIEKDSKEDIYQFNALSIVWRNFQAIDFDLIGLYAQIPCIKPASLMLDLLAAHGFRTD